MVTCLVPGGKEVGAALASHWRELAHRGAKRLAIPTIEIGYVGRSEVS